MRLIEFKEILGRISEIDFELSNGIAIPAHFHITEAGLTTKQFIDCGGTNRVEKYLSFQLWVSSDVDHRLSPEKVLKIITIAEESYAEDNVEIEIEYQTETISRFGLAFENNTFILTNKYTDCLAKDSCGTTFQNKQKRQLASLTTAKTEVSCSPGSGCC